MLPHDPTPSHRLPLARFMAAQAVINPVFQLSPQYDCEPLSEALGLKLTLKVETANPIRSFKGRGADYLVKCIKRSASPIVGASAGNWGQALAFACRATGQALIVFASTRANSLKVERMRALGADVRLHGEDFDASKMEAERFAATRGYRMVADGLDPEASIGAGTIAMELVGNGASYDSVLVPLGNGAMLTGIGRWFKAAAPRTRIIGVQAAGASTMYKSWRSGRAVVEQSIATIADGIGVRVPINEALDDMKDTVDDVVLVEDEHMIAAMQLLVHHAGLVTEPSGAAGVAALIADPERFKGQNAATIICGGNVSREQFRAWIGHSA